jgi:CheY-like chemotaxis protein/anti-sigma regulatory factor (Ser/Thr protein kinase)
MAKKGLDFTIKCTPESMMGWIDTDKLDKIIYNLLSNAAKYTQGDTGKVALQVNTNKKYDHIIIKVRDNGIGIPQEKMKKLFHRFYDGDYRRQRTMGTGLGLALTRELVYLHGGTIECESTEGEGTTFTVTLPINKESFTSSQIDERNKIDINIARSAILDIATRMQKEELEEEEPANKLDEDAYKLLVVEDNIELLMLMSQLLSTKYHVETATNGKEAMEIIQKEELDIIISDVMMPVMDGLELTKKIKADPNFQHLPIILLTAKTQEEDRAEALQIGADSYVTKPFKVSDLELQINNIVENRKRVLEEFKGQMGEIQQPQSAPEAEPTPDELFLQRAMDCVNKHLSDSDYDRETFAADMGASASTLYNKLRALTGMNVSNFIRDIRMKEAMEKGLLHRESQFMMGVPADRIDKELPSEELVLIQGIIDVWFEEDDGIVLLDYKTDKVRSGDELVSRYKVQLDYYQEALERITDKKVKERIIYSFTLGEAIEVP